MRMDGERSSDNIDDRRGSGPAMMAGGGIGIVGVIIVIIFLLMGGDPSTIAKNLPQGGGQMGGQQAGPGGAGGGPVQADPAEEKLRDFISRVLASTEDVWQAQLPTQANTRYKIPTLVLFRGAVQSACGQADSAVGPFYCPGDQQLYIDLGFYEQLQRQLGAPGDFAQAYVIAHEVGHHIQNLLGTSTQVDAQRRRMSEEDFNRLSVRMELQADFLAGVWAHHAQKTRRILEPGDLEEALRAANAIGDDTLQRRSQGRVVPDSFTHGTSAQRMKWFKLGFESGDMRLGDTFKVRDEDL